MPRPLGVWREDFLSGKPPVRFRIGDGALARVELGPGQVMLVGGAPGAGKTALIMQMAVDGLRLNPDLRAFVANVEMNPSILLERQLARFSGVDLTTIRGRSFKKGHRARLDTAFATIESIADRLCFAAPPFTLAHILAGADRFGGVNLLVLDYVQRLGASGEHDSKRAAVNWLVEKIRAVADRGAAVIAASALGRSRNKHGGSNYAASSMNLASFKESGELEYGCDDAHVLVPGKGEGGVTLRHLKARHGELRDIELKFDGAHQQFSDADPAPKKAATPRGDDDLAAAWEQSRGRGGEP